MSARSKVSIAIFVVAAFLGGVLFTTVGANLFGAGDRVATESAAQARGDGDTALDAEVNASAASLEEAFVAVAEAVSPTIVQIRSSRTVAGRSPGFNPFEGTPFEDFFGGPPGGEGGRGFQAQGLGSGVIARADGYVITNNHVIEDADQLEAALPDGRVFEAEVVGTDPLSDLAVIKIDASDLPTISYGDLSEVRVGQWALAFGSPFSQDLDNTVTAGIVSALGRTGNNLAALNLYAEFIQTDAAINPGNSGGPLVNVQGRMIGINTAIFSRSGGSQGIGFAIPISVVRNVVDQLIETGDVSRGYLGVQFNPVSESLAEALGVPRGAAQVVDVQPDTPASGAGLEAGEVIVAVNGRQLRDPNQLRTIIGNARPGNTVELEVVNEDGERRTVEVELGNQPEDLFAATGRSAPQGRGGEGRELDQLGLNLQNVSPQFLQRFGLEGADVQGVYVADIDQGSEAFREAELQRGDIITEIDKEPIEDLDAFMDLYNDLEPGETFLVRVLRPQRGGGQAQLSPLFTALTKPGEN